MLEVFGRYQLLKKLATGGMGQIFLARQKGPVGFEKLVVVKRILPHLSEEQEFIHMFFDEARIAALLNHPNIAQIYDLGEAEETFYIAMEYVHGVSLRALNERANRDKNGLPLGLKCRVIADAAAGLDFAHKAKNPQGKHLGLIHRDVSPQNILVAFNGSVKLIDFGVAKAAGKISTTMTGAIKGKYAYMSPEQARGEELDHRSDVFGLGIVFYEALTSSRLFKRESENATLKAVVGAKVTPPSELVKDLPKAIDVIALKALARRREDRFQSASEMQLALENFLVEAKQPATTAHLAAFVQELYSQEIAEEHFANEPTQIGHAPISTSARPKSHSGRNPSVSKSKSESRNSGRGRSTLYSQAELKTLLANVRPHDAIRGLLFNAVLARVKKGKGADGEAQVRAAAERPGTYNDALNYATSDFLRMVWKAAELLGTSDDPVAGFEELGKACAEGWAKHAGKTHRSAGELIEDLQKFLQSGISPGERALERTGERAASLKAKKELLPAPFYGGFLHQALKNHGTVSVVAQNQGRELTLNVSW